MDCSWDGQVLNLMQSTHHKPDTIPITALQRQFHLPQPRTTRHVAFQYCAQRKPRLFQITLFQKQPSRRNVDESLFKNLENSWKENLQLLHRFLASQETFPTAKCYRQFKRFYFHPCCKDACHLSPSFAPPFSSWLFGSTAYQRLSHNAQGSQLSPSLQQMVKMNHILNPRFFCYSTSPVSWEILQREKDLKTRSGPCRSGQTF